MEEELFKLLARIESKLNLLFVMVSSFEAQIPTIVARIRQAQMHLQASDSPALFFDLDWITRTLLGRKALRKQFEYQTLDLNALKEELRKFLETEKPEDSLAKAVRNQRKKLFNAFKNLEDNILILGQRARKNRMTEFYKPINTFLSLEKELKANCWTLSLKNQSDFFKSFSTLTIQLQEVISIINKAVSQEAEGLKWLIQKNWDDLNNIFVVIFNMAYASAKINIVVTKKKTKEGISYLEINGNY